MHITLIEPFFTGSHQKWAESFQKNSRHEVQILSLKGRHWKWRMFGGAVSLARMFKAEVNQTDLILVSDMLDLATFLGLLRKESQGISTAIYFHENQLTYPWSPSDEDVKKGRHNEYAFMNYTSALAADKLFFNSQYHLDSFINALPDFLKQFPDYHEFQNIELIKNKSQVLYLGMDLKIFDKYEAFDIEKEEAIILWNHRWEYDKNPESFFKILFELKNEGFKFKLVVLGEQYSRSPKIFNEAKIKLKDEILHFGFAASFGEYARWLKTSDIMPVTSNQDFFGGSVVEGIYCGAISLLPNRLAYPEHLSQENKTEFIYNSEKELKEKLIQLINNYNSVDKKELKGFIKKYDWGNCIDNYDLMLEK